MTRRIVLSVLALIAAVLGSVAVPLGILTAGQDQRAFTDETVATTTTLANVAEERLDDGTGARARTAWSASSAARRPKVSVFDRSGRKVSPAPHRRRGSASPACHRAQGQRTRRLIQATARFWWWRPSATMPTTGNVGTVALQRPTTTVDHRTTMLWWLVGLVSAAGLLAAALVAFFLARWVSRPLGNLEQAAQGAR